jgi:hypothetical protein
MGARHPPQQVGDREADGHQHADEDVCEEDADGRRERQQELAAPEPAQPPQVADLDQSKGGVDDDGPRAPPWGTSPAPDATPTG